MTKVKTLFLDGANWRTIDDFYDAFFEAVGAPDWHGRNFNALRDSILTGNINQIELPYVIHIRGLNTTPIEIKRLVEDFCGLIKDFRSEGHHVDVVCQD